MVKTPASIKSVSLFFGTTFGTTFVTALVLALSANLAQAETDPIDLDLRAEVSTGLILEQNNQHLEAVEFYTADISDKETRFGPFSQQLIDPLTGLARSYFAVEEYEEAQDSIRQAQHLMHRSDGVLSLTQLEAIDLLTQIHLRLNQPKLADQQQIFMLSIADRNFAPGSMALLPALDKITNWYQETGQLTKARKMLNRSADIIKTQAGQNDARLIPYLVQQAKVKRLQRICCSQNMLIRAIQISDQDAALKAQLYAELADAYTISYQRVEAEKFYKLAWEYMTEVQREVQFSEPKNIAHSRQLDRLKSSAVKHFKPIVDPFGRQVLQPISPQDRLIIGSLPPQEFFLSLAKENYGVKIRSNYHNTVIEGDYFEVVGNPFQFVKKQVEYILPGQWRHKGKLAQLEVELTFTVNKTGGLKDIEILHSNSPPKLDRLMKKVLKRTRMRPRMIDGEPVETRMVTLSQTFD